MTIFLYTIIYSTKKAGVAQLVEQLICNQSVMSSSLFTSYISFFIIQLKYGYLLNVFRLIYYGCINNNNLCRCCGFFKILPGNVNSESLFNVAPKYKFLCTTFLFFRKNDGPVFKSFSRDSPTSDWF